VTILPQPRTLDDLIEVLTGLSALSDLDQARVLRALDNRARAIIGEAGDAAVYRLTREATQTEVGALLGVTEGRVNNVVTRYHKRHGIKLPPGRPPK
jgi:DNA-directed RNA polymerase specialized sigma subunit